MRFVSKLTIKKENQNLRKSHNSTSSSFSQNCKAKHNFDPTKVLIVSAYVGLWIVHYMLVHASAHPRYEDASSRKLDPTFVILLTEFIKLIMSAVIYIAQRGVSNLCDNVTNSESFRIGPMSALFAQYLPIAFLYAVSNNLMINNLQYFDPTAYVILQSSRLIMTAIVMKIVMGRSINKMKQISILIITAGIFMKETPTSKSSGADNQSGGDSGIDTMSHYFHLGLIILQMLCGVLASLYNESLLKKNNKYIDINVGNMSLYIESILLNGFAMWMIPQGSLGHSSFKANIDMVRSSVLHQGIILTLAMVGIISSLMLRYVDTLSKAVASSTTILFTTVLGRIFFGLEISGMVIISAIFVSIGVHSYTFSNEESTNLTLILIIRSLSKTFRQLWFIPVFFYLISINNLVQYTSSLTPSFDGINPEMILHYGKVVSIENLENQHWLDENLHQLNGGQTLSASKWQQYVRLHLSNPLVKTLLEAKGCRVLDVGCGGGAFSRSLLKLHDEVEILGIDHEKLMIDVSHTSLQNETSNFKAAVASMEDASSMHEAIVNSGIKGAFHIAFLMDSLCYLPNNEAVQQSIVNALYPLYPGGLLVASMIPETLDAIQSCKIVISRDLIDRMKAVVGYEILDLNIYRSDNWENRNQTGRYSFVLKKTGHTTVDGMVLDKGVKFSNPFLNSTELDWTIPPPTITTTTTIKTTTTTTTTTNTKTKTTITTTVPKVKIRRYQEAQNVIHYITKKLEEKGAPLIIKFGTALHEFRAGVEGQFVPDIKDKDLDVGVFSRHFHFIQDMLPEIEELFGWKPDTHLLPLNAIKKMIIVLLPYDLTNHSSLNGFQIDIYGFHCDLEKNIAWWPWDSQKFRLDVILPLKAHTRIANRIISDTNGTLRQNANRTEISNHILYMPSNTSCYLENLFGHDFRIPKKTSFFRNDAYDDPVCITPIYNATERLEFMRQIMFCQHCESSEMNQNVIANYTSGLQVTSKLCTNIEVMEEAKMSIQLIVFILLLMVSLSLFLVFVGKYTSIRCH